MLVLDEEDVRKLAELKLRIEDRIRELEEELDTLREISRLLDVLLKKQSFIRASQVPPPEETREEEVTTRVLTRSKDGLHLATAKIYEDRVVITINPELPLRASIPPFRSFFVNRVLEGMREKDREVVGAREPQRILQYEIKEDPEGRIEQIEVRNITDKRRVNELLNALTWTLTKMLEKIEGRSHE